MHCWHEFLLTIRNTYWSNSKYSRKKYFCLRLLQLKNLAQIRLHLALSILSLAVLSPYFLALSTRASLKFGLSNQINAKISSLIESIWMWLVESNLQSQLFIDFAQNSEYSKISHFSMDVQGFFSLLFIIALIIPIRPSNKVTILRSIHGQPYGIDQPATVVADWSIRQFWHNNFTSFW